MTILEFYKQIEKNSEFRPWEIAVAFTVFNSVDCFVEDPTEEEYMTIYDVCHKAYLKAEDASLAKITDRVSEMYGEEEITLEELKNKSVYEILDLVDC